MKILKFCVPGDYVKNTYTFFLALNTFPGLKVIYVYINSDIHPNQSWHEKLRKPVIWSHFVVLSCSN